MKPDRLGRYYAAPQGRQIAEPLPWLMAELDADALSKDEYALRNEAFSPCVAVVAVCEAEPKAFLARATMICRDMLWGSLVASIVIHPEVEKLNPDIIDKAIAGLPYGSVVINSAGALGYTVEQATWGAFPGESLEAMESGVGQVKNILCLKDARQSVVRCPFISFIQAKRGQELNPMVATSLACVLVKPAIGSVSRLFASLIKLAFSRLVTNLATTCFGTKGIVHEPLNTTESSKP
jgi:hypothetical protein